jgi:hypothetical protein
MLHFTLILSPWCLQIQFLMLNTLPTLCNKIICCILNSPSLGLMGSKVGILKSWSYQICVTSIWTPDLWCFRVLVHTHGLDQSWRGKKWIGNTLLICGSSSGTFWFGFIEEMKVIDQQDGVAWTIEWSFFVAVSKLSALQHSWRVKVESATSAQKPC